MKRGELVQTGIAIIALLAGYAIVLLRDVLLPDRFLADGELIRDIALGVAAADDSYTNTANVYRLLGIADDPLIVYLFGYTAAAAIVAIVWGKCRRIGSGWQTTALLVVALLFAAIYLGYYSKDVMVLPIVAVAICFPPKWWSNIILVGLMLGYADLFRTYWYITAALFLAFWLLQEMRGRKGLLLMGGIAAAVASLLLSVILRMPADGFRTQVNDGRIGRIEVGTMITSFVDLPDPIGGVVNNVLTYVSLIFPVPVAIRGGLYYAGIAAVIFVIWFTFLRSAGRPMPVESQKIVIRANALILAFVVTQSLFEPDYGSALRHLTPLLPLFLYVAWQSLAHRRVVGATEQSSLRIENPSRVASVAS